MINHTICTIPLQVLVSVYAVIVYAPLAFVYFMVVIMFMKHHKTFHPLFVISFSLILLSYTTSHFILFFANLSDLIETNDTLSKICVFFFTFATYYTPAIVILTLLERLYATVSATKYEKSCHWLPYSIGQIICISYALFMYFGEKNSESIDNIQFIISLFTCLVLIVLFIVNRQKTKNAQSRLSLSTRYQLAENIKTLRIFVPFLLLDNVISTMFIFSGFTLSVRRKFSEPECMKSSTYVYLFILFRTIAIIIQISMALIVIHQHDSMRFGKIWKIFERRKDRAENILSIQSVTRNKVKNVLGKNIIEAGTPEHYFSQLNSQWMKK